MLIKLSIAFLLCLCTIACSGGGSSGGPASGSRSSDSGADLGAGVASPAPPLNSPTEPPPVPENPNPQSGEDFLDPSYSNGGVIVTGFVNLDVSLDDTKTYQVFVSLKSALVRDEIEIAIDQPAVTTASDGSSLSYSIHQLSQGVPVKRSDTFRSKLSATVLTTTGNGQDEVQNVVYKTQTPSSKDSIVESFFSAAGPIVEQNVHAASVEPIAVKRSATELLADLDPADKFKDITVLQTGIYKHDLYVIAQLPISCTEDDFTLQIDDQLIVGNPVIVHAQIVMHRNGDDSCSEAKTIALRFGLKPLLFKYEAMHEQAYVTFSLHDLGGYRPSPVPFAETRYYVDTPGCLMQSTCETILEFKTDGRLRIQSLPYNDVTAYIVSEDRLRVYTEVVGAVNYLLDNGETLSIPPVLGDAFPGELYLEK